MLKNIKHTTLRNGLKVLCLKKTSAPIVAMQVWYRTGSACEHDGIRGISHILEHMMFRGSKNVKSEEHAQKVNDVGGHSNAFTAEDVTAYINSVPSAHLEMVLALEADRMANLAVSPEILETERGVIVEEFHTYMNNPVTKAFLEFRKEFYGGHPYAWSPLGSLDDINRVSVDDCMSYYRQWYSPANAVAVIVGDFESEDAVFGLMEKHFGGIAVRGDSTATPAVPAAPGPQVGPAFMMRKVEFDVPLLLVGYPAPPSSHADAIALDILQIITSQGDTSRLHKEIVRRQALAVMTGGMNHFMRNSGMSLLFAAFTPGIPVHSVMAAIDGQVSRIRENGITDHEMKKIRNVTLSHRVFEMYSAEHLCQRLGFAETVEGDYRLWAERIAALERLDMGALAQVARTYWDETKKRTLYLQPKRAKPLLVAVGQARRFMSLFRPKGAGTRG
jgi:zinc protease